LKFRKKKSKKKSNGPRNEYTGNDHTKYLRKITVKRDPVTNNIKRVNIPKTTAHNPKIEFTKAYIKTEFLEKIDDLLKSDETTEEQLFYAILSEYLTPICNLAVEHTNKRIGLVNKHKKERNRETDIHEMWLLFGFHMEYVTNSSKNANIRDTIRNNAGVMGRQRLEFLRGNVVFLDPLDPDNKLVDKKYKKVIKIEELFNEISDFLICPDSYLGLDEGLLPTKARISFLQYCPAKPHKWGILGRMLANRSIRFCQMILFYYGKGLPNRQGWCDI